MKIEYGKELLQGSRKEIIEKLFFTKEKSTKIKFPTDILPLVDQYIKKKQEHFIAIYLNGAHEVIKKQVITMGLLNRCIIHPREIFRPAIKNNSASVILVHNHPSGSKEPSVEDAEVTQRMVNAGEILGIQILDHIIISKKGYYSFVENEKL